MFKAFRTSAVLMLLLSACSEEVPTRYTLANITDITVPTGTAVMQPIQIKTTAVGSNGCWNELHFELTQQSDFQYTLKAFGFVTGNTCPDLIVKKDTIITIIPEKVGTYSFNIHEGDAKVSTYHSIVAKTKLTVRKQ